jgi:hypothetical protein
MERDLTGEELVKWFDALKADRGNWEDLWEEIAEFILPAHRNFQTRLSEGDDRMERVYDSTAILSNERLASNLHTLLTNPATPWFGLRFRQKELNDSEAATEWLEACTDLMRPALDESNFDEMMGEFYLAFPAFGTAAIAVEEQPPEYGENDPNKFYGFQFVSHHLERVVGAEDNLHRFRDTFLDYEMDAYQLVQEFGADVLPSSVNEAYRSMNWDKKFQLIHAIYKRTYLDSVPDEVDVTEDNRAFASAHFLKETGDIIKTSCYY